LENDTTTDTTDVCPRQLVTDLLGGLATGKLRGNWCNGFWPSERSSVIADNFCNY